MKTLYIADDGNKFVNKWECKKYEFEILHPHLKTIEFYDENGNKLIDPMEENTYNNCAKIVIHSIEESNDLIEAGDYTGYSLYCNIVDIGTWVFDYREGVFIKYINPAFNKELSDKYVKKIADSIHPLYLLLDLLIDLGYKEVVNTYCRKSTCSS